MNHFFNIFDVYFDLLFPPREAETEAEQKREKTNILFWAKAIKDLRDPLSHPGQQSFPYEDAFQLVDYARRIVARFDTSAAEQIGTLAVSLREADLNDASQAWSGQAPTESLREAVNCFRHELLLPSLAMLTKGTEGAWTELGAALADFGTRAGDSHGVFLRKKLENPFTGLKERIDKVAEYYRRPVCDVLVAKSGVARSSINQAAIWSDEVRDSRNVLHFGKLPAVPITYERVAVLMMATVGHLRAMYEIKSVADASP